jgi:CCR4-NOT transcription complex subunit 1
MYLKFLDKVNSKALNKEIVQATYENCKVLNLVTVPCLIEVKNCKKFEIIHGVCTLQVLLGSELIKSSSEERSLLKNLGSWLGKLTIGRNQVLRAREIDPKSLIIEVISQIEYMLGCNSISIYSMLIKVYSML